MAKIIKHIGTPRHSGRYPWGSGKHGYQRNKSFLGYVLDLKKQGLTDTEIAQGLGISTRQLRARRAIATSENRAADAALAMRLKEKGYSTTAIAKRMGKNESSVRSLLDPVLQEKANMAAVTAMALKDNVDKKGFIDVGAGVEQHLGISATKLNVALAMLEEEGYTVHQIAFKQVGTGKYTIMKVLAPPGTEKFDVLKNKSNIKTITDYSEDGGRSILGVEPPTNVSTNRIMIRYGDEGGSGKDGVLELRRGVDDIDLGNAHYAQVRVAVEGGKFMKGMALYSDNMPPGVDIIYNTNKLKGTPEEKVFKSMKTTPDGEIDTDNPFGASIRQKHYIDADGNERLSAINVVGYANVPGSGEEGSWREWSRTLSSQVLSKQTPALAKKQLGLALDLRQEEYDEIMSMTNPAVKKALLKPFSDECDGDAVHLKAAALPRQANHVILPIESLKDNEVYAPNYTPGENVVLIRHPHGGIFEIPTLRVNNDNPEGKSILGDAIDGIGINSKVASRLSGADFDGDTVLVIPIKNQKIQTSSPLAGLKDFDTRTAFPGFPGMHVMTEPEKQLEMGKVSNLITDMTIRGANEDEIARAVKHSMVVIDSVKHELNYQESYLQNNIAELKKIYQGSERSGASTLISRAKSPVRVPERREGVYVTDPKTGKTKRVYIDPKTGKYLYRETGRVYKERKKVVDLETGKTVYVDTGKILPAQTKISKMAKAENAYELSSGTVMENIYADHANALKSLANKARLSMLQTENLTYSKSARETYAKEVSRLNSALALAYKNKPRERQAQLMASKVIAAKRRANPEMTPADLKKIRGQALEEARARFKAKKPEIEISDREWEAIQAGAVSNNTLVKILANTNMRLLKQRAMPRYSSGMSPARLARARSMIENGHTRYEIADSLGISISTLDKALKS